MQSSFRLFSLKRDETGECVKGKGKESFNQAGG